MNLDLPTIEEAEAQIAQRDDEFDAYIQSLEGLSPAHKEGILQELSNLRADRDHFKRWSREAVESSAKWEARFVNADKGLRAVQEKYNKASAVVNHFRAALSHMGITTKREDIG